MANTYTQIHIHIVFAVKYRECLIDPLWKNRLFEYMNAILQNRQHKVLAINGTKDHVHIFIGMRPHQSVSEIVQVVKRDSSRWINEQGLTKRKFRWQEGYGAFSYSKSQVGRVMKYIRNQEKHHMKRSFDQEYKEILELYGIDYNENYLFEIV